MGRIVVGSILAARIRHASACSSLPDTVPLSSLACCCSAVKSGAAALASGRPAVHPLLPTANMGLVLVSCTAKGRQLYREAGVEAALVHGHSGQVGAWACVY